MAKFELTAHACTFNHSPTGWVGRQHRLLAPPLAKAIVEHKTCDGLLAALRDFKSGVETDGSYFVSARLTEGRAPAGFRNRKWELEIDRDAA